MEIKDMLDPKQAKAIAELMNKSTKAKSSVKTEVQFVPKNKSSQKNQQSKSHSNLYGSRSNTIKSNNMTMSKTQTVLKTNQTVDLYVIDNGAEICPIHKTHLQKKEFNLINKIKMNSAALTISALHCAYCNKNYIEEKKQSTLLAHIKRGYPIRIKLYEETKRQIESRIENYPVDIKLSTPIHILEGNQTGHAAVKCPVHGWDLKIYKMKRNYDQRSVSFVGYLCEHCKRVYMLRSAAEEMLYFCGEIGIPSPEFISSAGKEKNNYSVQAGQKNPKYIIYDGKKVPFDINLYEVNEWLPIEPSDDILVSFSINCELEDHVTELYWCRIDVLEKSGVENQYVVKMGYCSTCDRFYIPADDYSVIYQAGKAKALVSDSTGEFDLVKAGKIFDTENEHLIKFQHDADEYIDQLKERYHYVPKYATSSDGYEDIGRLSSSKRECEGLYEEIELISDYSSRPYSNRVDICHGKNHKEYYIGAIDYNLPGYSNVISRWSDLGEKLGNYKSFEIEQDGEKYKVKLRRMFEIIGGRLYGYQNLYSPEEKHFRDGLTDPFLVKVLRTRQSQHRLTDILLTIQDKQYEIIEQDINQNIIVQGCAGSGKTMVLLHRLSYLNYNYKGLDLNKIIILTPNSNFNMHIQGLTESLSLSKIERKNIEDYYMDLLTQYNQDITEGNRIKILREENIKAEYINYVYSDKFLEDMMRAYREVVSEYWESRWIVEKISSDAKVDFAQHDNEPIYLKIEQLKKHTELLQSLAESKEQAVNKKIEKITNLEQELNRVREMIVSETEKMEKFAKGARENIPLVIDELINVRNGIINNQSKKSLLQRLRAIGSNNEEELEQAVKDLTELETFREIDWLAASYDQIFEILKSLLPYREDLRKDLTNFGRQLNQVKLTKENEVELKRSIDAEMIEFERLEKENWSKDFAKRVSEISEKIKGYTHSNILKTIYSKATESARTKYSVRTTLRNLYRFDLYALLNIAILYYDKTVGTHNYLYIDEGQDLSLNEIKLLKKLHDNKAIFNIYGDTNQLLKIGRGISNWTDITKELQGKLYVLNENYRNTNQITRYCNEHFNMRVVLTGVEGRQVKEIQRHTLETELNKINLGDERLAILVPRLIKKEQYIDYDRLSEPIRKVIGSVVGNGNIALMYVDEVKGMEFDTVYVVGNGMTENEKYIALTRALMELIVVNDIDLESKRIADKNSFEN